MSLKQEVTRTKNNWDFRQEEFFRLLESYSLDEIQKQNLKMYADNMVHAGREHMRAEKNFDLL